MYGPYRAGNDARPLQGPLSPIRHSEEAIRAELTRPNGVSRAGNLFVSNPT